MSFHPKCPRCDTREVTAKSGYVEGYDGVMDTTHECERCHTQFRVTPPDAFLTDETRKDAPYA